MYVILAAAGLLSGCGGVSEESTERARAEAIERAEHVEGVVRSVLADGSRGSSPDALAVKVEAAISADGSATLESTTADGGRLQFDVFANGHHGDAAGLFVRDANVRLCFRIVFDLASNEITNEARRCTNLPDRWTEVRLSLRDDL